MENAALWPVEAELETSLATKVQKLAQELKKAQECENWYVDENDNLNAPYPWSCDVSADIAELEKQLGEAKAALKQECSNWSVDENGNLNAPYPWDCDIIS